MRNRNNRKHRRRAQGMTEYIILVGLIALGLIGAVNAFKSALDDSYNTGSGKVEEVTEMMDGNGGGSNGGSNPGSNSGGVRGLGNANSGGLNSAGNNVPR